MTLGKVLKIKLNDDEDDDDDDDDDSLSYACSSTPFDFLCNLSGFPNVTHYVRYKMLLILYHHK